MTIFSTYIIKKEKEYYKQQNTEALNNEKSNTASMTSNFN
jgi:hypothetical protein